MLTQQLHTETATLQEYQLIVRQCHTSARQTRGNATAEVVHSFISQNGRIHTQLDQLLHKTMSNQRNIPWRDRYGAESSDMGAASTPRTGTAVTVAQSKQPISCEIVTTAHS